MNYQRFFLIFFYITSALAGASLLFLAVGASLSRTRWWRRIALFHTQTPQHGYTIPQHPPTLLGQHGLTQTPLHPTGKVLIQDRTYQATTEGTYIAPQATVVVTAITGHTLVVAPPPSV